MSVPSIVRDPERLHSAPRRPVLVDVPELPFVVVDGTGPPESEAFAAAVQALYSVTYGLHFALARRLGSAPKVQPLEALWWSEDPAAFASAMQGRFTEADRAAWLWSAMIAQPAEVDSALVEKVVADAAARKTLPALRWLRFTRWREGLCAQVMHVGPYADEPATVAVLDAFIAEQGYAPTGRHHEVYLGDPRRCAPERLRTILRRPVVPTS